MSIKLTLRQLKKSFKEMVKFLKHPPRTNKKSKRSLYAVPWHLILGTPLAGKTSLLKKSDLHFILQKKIKAEKGEYRTTQQSFWVTAQSLFVDTPEIQTQTMSTDQKKIWVGFFKLLRRFSFKHQLASISLVLRTDDLEAATLKKNSAFFENIAFILKTLHQRFKNTPLYIFINQCDRIPGFVEFFSDSSEEDRAQHWGIPGNLANFDTEFDQLIERLNAQLIWRLQHESDPARRFHINDFPCQVAVLKPNLQNFLKKLFEICPTIQKNLQGLFLTAASPSPQITYQSNTTALSEQHTLAPIQAMPEKPFFVHHLFQRITQHTLKTKISFLRTLLYGMATAITFGFVTLYGIYFHAQLNHINSAEKALLTYQILIDHQKNEPMTLINKIKLLETLASAHDALTAHTFSPAFLLHPFQPTNKLTKNTEETYQTALNTLLWPELIRFLENKLNDKTTPPDQLYLTLKTYLMLANKDHTNPQEILLAMQKLWQPNTPMQPHLLKQLHALLSSPLPSFTANSTLVSQARAQLKHLPINQLAYLILENDIPNNQWLSLNLNQNNNNGAVLTLTSNTQVIPSMYTGAYFSQIYPKLIEQATLETLAGNWVIGNLSSSPVDTQTATFKTLEKNLTDQYLNQYAQTWLSFLNTIQLVNNTNLNQVVNTLNILKDSNSPLAQLVLLVHDNIPTPILNNNARLAALANLSASNDTVSLSNALNLLNQLYTYIAPLESAPDSSATIFEYTQNRMRASLHSSDPITAMMMAAPLYPEPIKTWLYTIADNTWQLMLYQTQTYINEKWKNALLPDYESELANAFPFATQSNENVSLDNFEHFFAPNGVFDRFFVTYLSPFIDTSKTPWKLKNRDGETLQMSDLTLKNLADIYRWQNLFFAKQSPHPHIAFWIAPISLEDNLASVTFVLGSQRYTFNNGTQYAPVEIFWPDADNANEAKIIFTEKDGTENILSAAGPWAIFKLLGQQIFTPLSANHLESQVTLDKNGDAATFQITLTTSQNPFSLQRFANFRLPNDLT